ncbi:hypothetical protein CSUI_003598 [Cystoisospora suis]|uniref:Uncharacterized protein n=1 Tax=Cystoisospora suis TaxID=483139 RepID=A0A2C6KEY2_9APIC|nr:hypothetical protein CSUI_003598 [Cystoisospora suis]
MLVLKRKFGPAFSTVDSHFSIGREPIDSTQGGGFMLVSRATSESLLKQRRYSSRSNPQPRANIDCELAKAVSTEDVLQRLRFPEAVAGDKGDGEACVLLQVPEGLAGTCVCERTACTLGREITDTQVRMPGTEKEESSLEYNSVTRGEDEVVVDEEYRQRKLIWTSQDVSAGAALFGRPYRIRRGKGNISYPENDTQASSSYLGHVPSRDGF